MSSLSFDNKNSLIFLDKQIEKINKFIQKHSK